MGYELTKYGKALVAAQDKRDKDSGVESPTPVLAMVGKTRVNLRNATSAQLELLHNGVKGQTPGSAIVNKTGKQEKTNANVQPGKQPGKTS